MSFTFLPLIVLIYLIINNRGMEDRKAGMASALIEIIQVFSADQLKLVRQFRCPTPGVHLLLEYSCNFLSFFFPFLCGHKVTINLFELHKFEVKMGIRYAIPSPC